MKASEISDYSVGTLWLVSGGNCYLLEVIRDRFDFPDLRRALLEQAKRWRPRVILIEDKGSGTSLIQDLRAQRVSVIPVKAEQDKITRLYTVQHKFESKSVFFPRQAPWLQDLIAELLAFPHGRHDDQVDSISQALAWIERHRPPPTGYSTPYGSMR